MQIMLLTFPSCLSWSWIIPHQNVIFIVGVDIFPPSGFIDADPTNIGCTSITYKFKHEKQACDKDQLVEDGII